MEVEVRNRGRGGNFETQRFYYAFEKPNRIRIDMESPHPGRVLVYPDKKLSSVKPKSVKKRMKAKEFARSVNRSHIMLCEELGMSLDDFIEVSLQAMTEISDVLGLA